MQEPSKWDGNEAMQSFVEGQQLGSVGTEPCIISSTAYKCESGTTAAPQLPLLCYFACCSTEGLCGIKEPSWPVMQQTPSSIFFSGNSLDFLPRGIIVKQPSDSIF